MGVNKTQAFATKQAIEDTVTFFFCRSNWGIASPLLLVRAPWCPSHLWETSPSMY